MATASTPSDTYGDVTVNNAGSIAGSSFTSNATGVNIGSFYGNATVNNTGHIEAYSLTDDAVGVSVLSV